MVHVICYSQLIFITDMPEIPSAIYVSHRRHLYTTASPVYYTLWVRESLVVSVGYTSVEVKIGVQSPVKAEISCSACATNQLSCLREDKNGEGADWPPDLICQGNENEGTNTSSASISVTLRLLLNGLIFYQAYSVAIKPIK